MVDLDSGPVQGNLCRTAAREDDIMTPRRSFVVPAFVLGLVIASACRPATETAAPTPDDAQQFVAAAEQRLEILGRKLARAAWVQNNFITADTEQIAADAQSDVAAAVTDLARGARRFEGLALPQETARTLMLLKLQLVAPAPDNGNGQRESAVEDFLQTEPWSRSISSPCDPTEVSERYDPHEQLLAREETARLQQRDAVQRAGRYAGGVALRAASTCGNPRGDAPQGRQAQYAKRATAPVAREGRAILR